MPADEVPARNSITPRHLVHCLSRAEIALGEASAYLYEYSRRIALLHEDNDTGEGRIACLTDTDAQPVAEFTKAA